MEKVKKANLLNLSAEMLADAEMNEVLGGGVSCRSSNCGSDANVNVNHCMENLRKNNPPTRPTRPDTRELI